MSIEQEYTELKTLGTVQIYDMKNALKQVESFYDKMPEPLPRDKKVVSFEYIIGSFFPEVMDNIRAEMTRQYALGYKTGLEDRNEDQRNN